MSQIVTVTAQNIEQFEKMLSTNPILRDKIKSILKKVMAKVRTQVSKDARNKIDYDPRASYRAVKRSVYKTILGGSVSILNKRKSSSTKVHVQHERKQVIDKNGQHRGGNRRDRIKRTDEVDSYYGSDRGFILRYLNNGTNSRNTRYGNRGQIAPNNWFADSSKPRMEQNAELFCQLVEQELQNIINQSND